MKNLAVLMDAICDAYDKVWLGLKPFAPLNGVTHCNEAVQSVAHTMGFDGFAGKMANEMIDVLNHGEPWIRIDHNEAAERAESGLLVVAARKAIPHGHVCVVRPGTLETSGHWQEKAPKVMNIGKDCFMSKGANFAFHEKPDYYSLEP